ncbi:MAG: efflux RND transporter periplasmic adaptor subunit [Burkholderiaceae bacterium]|nr:efflux RND transporter periplasmic adaptor subunit [Burkholderiaceae bacterium]
MTKRMLIMLGCVLLLVLALAFGFYLHIQKLIASSPKPGAQTVSSAKVEALEWQPQLASVGTIMPVRGVDVTTEIAGLVRQVNFKSGEEVKAGDLLVQLNDDSDVAQLNSLQAAADLAATVLTRDKLQFAAQAISQAQVDADTADLKSKRALVEQQKALVQKKAIRAPFSGELGITTVNPGQYLNPGDKIVSLEKIDPIYVDFYVPQKQVAGLTIGQSLNLSSDAYAGVDFAGKITALNPKIDPTTRNVQIEATLSNPKHQLLPGMFANVKVNMGEKKQYLTLPQTAITYNPYGSTVFVIAPDDKKDAKKDDKGNAQLVAQQVFVTTGATRGDQVAVLTGLKAGQQVVTTGQIKLKNGTPVIVDNTVSPANSPNPTPQEH